MENKKHTGRYAKRGDFSEILVPLLQEGTGQGDRRRERKRNDRERERERKGKR